MTSTTNEILSEKLRQAGLRLTPQRLAIYQALLRGNDHPTAQQLFEKLNGELPSLSQATVYNTLQTLVIHGLIQELGDAGDGVVHYDANLQPHINLICMQCHRVEDFFDLSLEGVAQQVASGTGYKIRGARVAYYGLCPRCQRELSAS